MRPAAEDVEDNSSVKAMLDRAFHAMLDVMSAPEPETERPKPPPKQGPTDIEDNSAVKARTKQRTPHPSLSVHRSIIGTVTAPATRNWFESIV